MSHANESHGAKRSSETKRSGETKQPSFSSEIDLSSLRTLLAVVESGSFSGAARRIGRTQSADRLKIAKLEERLHTRLLDRTSRRVSLSSAGDTFADYARRILDLTEEAVRSVTSSGEIPLLRVGFAEYLVPDYLPALLARFRFEHPDCDLNLVMGSGGSMLASLERAGLGLSVLPQSAVRPDMQILSADSFGLPPLPNTRLLRYVRPEHLHPYAERLVEFLLGEIEDSNLLSTSRIA